MFCLSSHLLVDTWVASTFWLLWIMLQWKTVVKVYVWVLEFSSLEYILKCGIATSFGNHCLTFWGTTHTVFYSHCTTLHPEHPCRRFLFLHVLVNVLWNTKFLIMMSQCLYSFFVHAFIVIIKNTQPNPWYEDFLACSKSFMILAHTRSLISFKLLFIYNVRLQVYLHIYVYIHTHT